MRLLLATRERASPLLNFFPSTSLFFHFCALFLIFCFFLSLLSLLFFALLLLPSLLLFFVHRQSLSWTRGLSAGFTIQREPSKSLLGSVCFKREFFPFTAQAFSGRLLSQKRKGKRKKRRKRSGSGMGKVGNWRESGQGDVLTFFSWLC